MNNFTKIVFAFLSCSLSMLKCSQQEDILQAINDQKIAAVDFIFTDLLGNLKAVTLPARSVETALHSGLKFDGSSVPGCSNISESDMHLAPDLTTWRIIPEEISSYKKGLIVCDVYLSEQEIYTGDARQQLKTALKCLLNYGLTLCAGAELEFYLLDHDHRPYDNHHYFDYSNNVDTIQLQNKFLDILQNASIYATKVHHEVSSGQYEIVLHHTNALKLADNIMIAKHLIQIIAQKHNLEATFMPKPIKTMNGSGMHIHYSLWHKKEQTNAFYNEQQELYLSELARQFIAGNLQHMPTITICFNSTINSYKRLVPGYEAPIYICWGSKNRSALIRIPQVNLEEKAALRAELRSPDALCNPYLALAALTLSGLAGIEEKNVLAQQVTKNLYKLAPQEQKALNIQSLPASLQEALTAFENSPFVQQQFDPMLIQQLVHLKNKELKDFATAITDWELAHYC